MIRVLWFVLLWMGLVSPVAATPGDAAVLQARQSYTARQAAALERAARQVPSDHVLSPTVEYWRLMLASRDDDARIADFTSSILAEDEKPEAAIPSGGVPLPAGGGPDQAYYDAVTKALDAMYEDSFNPSLFQLDALIQSITVTP